MAASSPCRRCARPLNANAHFCSYCGLSIHATINPTGVSPTADDLPLYASDAHANRRLMDNNPIDMSVEDVLAIYKAAF